MIKASSFFRRPEGDHARYVDGIGSILEEIFGFRKDDDHLWREWVRVGDEDIGTFLGSETREVFKARLIAISLAPSSAMSPFPWGENRVPSDCFSLWETVKFSNLSTMMRRFVTGIIEFNVDEVINDGDSELRDSLYRYNRIILQALASLPDDDPMAERLFNCFQLNDPRPFYDLDSESGYNPFYELVNEPMVPRKWKTEADAKMRDIIVSEERGISRSRAEWEGALKCYMHQIERLSGFGMIPYHSLLFASQIRFILEFDRPFRSSYLYGILTVIREEKHRDLRHRLARHAVLSKEGFKVCAGTTLFAAKTMLGDFGNEDQELRISLEEAIAEVEAGISKKNDDILDRKRVSNSILERMR